MKRHNVIIVALACLFIGSVLGQAFPAREASASDWNERSARALEDIASKMGRCCK
jgi:hypothetical protein